MKIKGHTFEEPSVEIVALNRGMNPKTGEKVPDIVFHCGPVRSYEEFDSLCPIPTAPTVIRAGGKRDTNHEDPGFLSQIEARGQLRMAYIVTRSLMYTEGLEWEKVVLDKPKTWKHYREELKEAGLLDMEITRVENACFAANSLNQARIDEALSNFLRGQAEAAAVTSGLHTDQDSSQSGEPAKGGE